MASSSFRWIYNVFASFIGEFFRKLFRSHLVKEFDRKMMDTSEDDEIEINSSSCSRRYDVFPSFSGGDVRKSFLSHLLKELDRRSINTFMDHEIERSRPIGPELLSAIRESSISIVVLSKNYASSTWCLNELVEIHECYKDSGQMVIPVFYNVDPSDVKKQTGEFGKVFKVTCKNKTEDQKQRWVQALADVASMAGEDLQNGPDEAHVVEKIANDVSNKLFSPSNSFGDLVGIEAHLEAMKSILYLESKEARMVGIWGTSGIGKSTIGRALFSQLSGQFPLRAFVTYRKSTDQLDVSGMKSSWEQKFLSEILGQKDIKIEHFGEVEKRLKDKKVLIVLDDVDNLEFLKTLVGKTEWFGPGSRIIVITQDRRLLKAHDIDLLYEVKFPSEDLALKMLCRSAFEQDSPPDDFKELADEVATLAGNFPLGLSVLGSSLKRMEKKEWMELLPELQNGLDGDIMTTLRVSYDRLAEKYQYLFHYIASVFNGQRVEYINDFLGDVNTGLKTLADKSLICITPDETVEMHNLLQKLSTEIDRAESKGNPGKRRFLEDAEEIQGVFTDKTGTETVLGILFNAFSPSQINKSFTFQGTGTVLGIRFDALSPSPPFISIDEKSFEGMLNLQFLKIHDHSWWQRGERRLRLPNGLVYLPRKLKYIEWDCCPFMCLPSNFKAEYLVELRMENSKLEKLWEGTQLLVSLKTMLMRCSKYLKEIPDLSKAINLKEVDISYCEELESFPTPLNSESLEYLNLLECPRLKNLPEIKMQSFSHGIEILVEDCIWNKNLPGLDYLDCLKRSIPSKFRPEHLVRLTVKGNMLMEKLWEGVQSLGSLVWMDLSGCGNLTEIPDLSKATNLEELILSNCKSLVMLPSTIGNLQKLVKLEMKECTGLEVLPVDANLSSLRFLDLRGCSSLRSFPQISSSIETLNLDETAIEEVPCCIEMLPRLTKLKMHGCKKLKNISPNIFSLTSYEKVDFTDCGGVITALSDVTVVATMEDHYEYIEKKNNVEKRRTRDKYEDEGEGEDEDDEDEDGKYFNFQNCFKLDGDARELILRSCFKWTMVLPGKKVPTYFEHRASGNSLTVTLPQSSLSQEFLRFNACFVVEPLTDYDPCMSVHFHFNGKRYSHKIARGMPLMCEAHHLVLFSFKFRPTGLPSKLDFNDVEFEFSYFNKRIKKCRIPLLTIKECGIRLLNVSPYPDDSDGSSETEYNQQSGEKYDVVETESSKKRMRMTLEKSEEYFNLPCGQIVTDTGLTAPNLELPLGRGESSSESGALCVDSMITEQQDAQIPIVDSDQELLWNITDNALHSFEPSFRENGVDAMSRTMEKPRNVESVEKYKPSELMEIVDPAQCRQVTMPDSKDSVSKVARLLYTNSGVGILALGTNGVQRLWKWSRNEQNPTGKATASVTPQHWQPNSGLLMTNDVPENPEGSVPCIALSKNDSYVISACGGKVSLFNMMTFKVMATFMPPPPASTFLAFHPRDNNIIAIGMDDSTIHIYNVRVDELITKLKGHQKHITGLAFSAALNILVSSGADAQLFFWSTESWEKKKSSAIPLRKSPVGDTRVQFHNDQVHLLISHETQIAIYDCSKMECIQKWVPQESLSSSITCASFSCNSQLVYVSFADGNIGVFDAEYLRLRCRIAPSAYMPQPTPNSTPIMPLVITAHPQEPNQIAVGLSDGWVKVLETPEQFRRWGVAEKAGTENGRPSSASAANNSGSDQIQR